MLINFNRYINCLLFQEFLYAIPQIVAARSAVVLGDRGSELKVRLGPDRVGEGAGAEGEAQRRARTQEEDLGKQTRNLYILRL